MLLRIEDLDRERSKSEYIELIQRDFEALGLYWDEGPIFQSDREEAYLDAFSELDRAGLIYPCFCSRAQIKAARDIASAPHMPDASFYPGTCRDIPQDERARLIQKACDIGSGYSSRLRTEHSELVIHDIFQGEKHSCLNPAKDDFIVRRSDGLFAYQLAVVVDDAEQDINLVSRGVDLLPSTPRQIYLHQLLGHTIPRYAHFPLFVNNAGKRLAKRDRSAALDELIATYREPEAVIGHIAYIGGIIEEENVSASPSELLRYFDESALAAEYKDAVSIPYI